MRSRFDQLVGVFSALVPIAAGGCADRAFDEDGLGGSILDDSIFDDSVCDASVPQLLEGVSASEPTDFLQLRDVLTTEDGEYVISTEVLDAAGEPCAGARDIDRCGSDLAGLPPHSELSMWTFLGIQHRSLIFTRGDDAGAATSLEHWRELVAPVDTAEDAALMVLGHFHDPVCDGRENVIEERDGYRVLTRTPGGTCGRGVEEHVAWVSADGAVEIVETRVVEEDLSCVGRLPAGLRRSRPGRNNGPSSVGRFFAAMAELEAAAVTAFEQLATELAIHGAPPALVREARNARADEIRHARAAARLARRHGGRPVAPRVRPWAPRSLFDVAADNAVEGCIRETYGALIAAVQGRRASDPLARRMLRRIAIDETRHAALSWELAQWADGQLSSSQRRRVAVRQRIACDRLERTLTRPQPESVHCVTGLPEPDDARRLYAALRPHMLA